MSSKLVNEETGVTSNEYKTIEYISTAPSYEYSTDFAILRVFYLLYFVAPLLFFAAMISVIITNTAVMTQHTTVAIPIV